MNTMKVGVKDGDGNFVEVIETVGMGDFMDCIFKYQGKGYTDLYAERYFPDKEGFDAMFIAPKT
jgi:hypothetical protein